MDFVREMYKIQDAIRDGRTTEKSLSRKVKALTDQFQTLDELKKTLDFYKKRWYLIRLNDYECSLLINTFCNTRKYNDKNLIYGISSKFIFNEWSHDIYVFNNETDANQWLNTEEYDFRERYLFFDEWHAIRHLGKGGKRRLEQARKDFLNNDIHK